MGRIVFTKTMVKLPIEIQQKIFEYLPNDTPQTIFIKSELIFGTGKIKSAINLPDVITPPDFSKYTNEIYHYIFKNRKDVMTFYDPYILKPFLACAAEYGRIDVLEYFYKQKKENITEHVILSSCSGGQTNVIKWCIDKNIRLPDILFQYASIYGHLEILKLFNRDMSVCILNEALFCANAMGNHEIAKYLIDTFSNSNKK